MLAAISQCNKVTVPPSKAAPAAGRAQVVRTAKPITADEPEVIDEEEYRQDHDRSAANQRRAMP
jgi:hypothetical protein